MPSSTSSSRRWPLAGLIALALVVAIDRILFGALLSWEDLAGRVPHRERPHHHVARAEADLAALRGATGRPRVVVMGSSRAEAGFDAPLARRAAPEIAWAEVAYAALRPFEMRSRVGDLRTAGADAVVLVLSEYDLYRPLRLDPVPGTAVADSAALFELARRAGPALLRSEREIFYRIPLSQLFDSYRFRVALSYAPLLRPLLHPARDAERFPSAPFPAPRRPLLAGRPRALDPAALDAALDALPPKRRTVARFQAIEMLTETAPGPQVALQQELLRQSFELLQRAGIAVVVCEAPLHPAVAPLYDSTLRPAFLAWIQPFARSGTVRFAPLEGLGALAPEDFGDLLHLDASGAAIFTRRIVSLARSAIGPAPGENPAGRAQR